MSDLTTAQRLAAYRDELISLGFGCAEVWRLVEKAAPSHPDEAQVDDVGDVGDLVLDPDTGLFVPRAPADQPPRLVKRTIGDVGGLLRVVDAFSDGRIATWHDSASVEVVFAEDDSTTWNVHPYPARGNDA